MKKILLTIFGFTVIFIVSSFVCIGQFSVDNQQSFVQIQDTSLRIIHVYVALCDNDSQGIIPVPKKVGNGNDPANNLFWGAHDGIKTFFSQSEDWELMDSTKNISKDILQRCVWRNRRFNCYLVADAYKGARIKNCTLNFLMNLSGHLSDTARFTKNGKNISLLMEHAKLVCYFGHDGFMDFDIPNPPPQNSAGKKDLMIFASASKLYFKDAILTSGGNPLLWTTNLLTPEAYLVKVSIDGWLTNESGIEICSRAARAYADHGKCSSEDALLLFSTGYY